jgi:hypothetical protein
VSNSINSKNFTVSFVVNGLLFLSEKSELWNISILMKNWSKRISGELQLFTCLSAYF